MSTTFESDWENTRLKERIAELKKALVASNEDVAGWRSQAHRSQSYAEQQEQERDQLREHVKMLRAWIKQQGEITDTCTFNILREVCENCACHRNKALAAKEPRK